MPQPSTAGPFVLERRLARGGMGEVWAARLGRSPVAVKFLASSDPFVRTLFARETQAHARLQHPAILRVLDHGMLEAPIPDGPEVGSPWLALEFVSGGDLVGLMPKLRWSGTRVVLLTLLDALSHAHAHGVVHCDLKPRNVLVADHPDPDPGLRLADFGIARLRETFEPSSAVLGSPSTIAPEQCRGASREVGPWTDLYALGCMAFRLVSGGWPFSGQALQDRSTAPFPALAPRFPVPAGFEGWLRRMVAAEVRERFHACAEAAEGLRPLALVGDEEEALPAPLAVARSRLPARPTGSWRVGGAVAELPIGAGRGIAPLRAWRTEGREAEREALWQVLQKVRAEGRCAAVVLRGPPGSGRTHLGRWLVRTAVEAGVALGWETGSLVDDRPGDAVRRLLGKMLGAEGLSGPELVGAVRTHLGLWDRSVDEDLVQALVVGLDSSGSSRVRRGALRRWLVDRAAGSAGVVWFDDAGEDRDVLRFVSTTVQHRLAAPLVFVVGAGEGGGEELEALEGLDGVRTVRLGRLRDRDITCLIGQSLTLVAGTAARLVQASAGSPRRCRELVDRLASDPRVRATRFGFSLPTSCELPVAVEHDPQRSSAADTLASELDGASLRRLARAAVLGDFVPHGAWARACGDGPVGASRNEGLALAPLVARVRLSSRLQELGLATELDAGWRWDPAARVAVLARLPADLVTDAHRAVADLLAEDPATGDVLARRARHLRDGGRPEEALGAYLRWLVETPDERSRLALCDEALAVASRAGLARGDARVGQLRGHRLHAMPMRPSQELLGGAAALANDAAAFDWADVGDLARVVGALGSQLARGVALHTDELPPVTSGATPLSSHARLYVADAWRIEGRSDRGRALAEQALADARVAGWTDLVGRAEVVIARIDAQDPATDPVRVWEQAADQLRRGFLLRARTLRSAAATLAYHRGELDRADRWFEQTHQLDELAWEVDLFPTLMRAQMAVERGDGESAARHLADSRTVSIPHYRRWWRCLEVARTAVIGDANACGAQLVLLGGEIGTEDREDPMMLDLLRGAADRFDRLGHRGLASELRRLAGEGRVDSHART